MQLQARTCGVLMDFRARTPQVVVITARDGDEPGQSDLAVAFGQLRLAADRRVLHLSLARGLGLAKAVTAASTSRVDRSGDTGSNVTATVLTVLERPSSASMNIGETSTRGHAPIQYVAWTAPSVR